MNRAIRLKFGTELEDRPILRENHIKTPKWAWPGSRDPISKFWDPLITFEWIELYASNLVGTLRDSGPPFRRSAIPEVR